MMRRDSGPPEKEAGPLAKGPANAEDTPITSTASLNGARRRCAAARRLLPLGRCGCIRDPDHDRHRCGGQISERQVAGAVAAAHHLRSAGLPPIFDLPTLRALWRPGHHQLVDQLRGGGR